MEDSRTVLIADDEPLLRRLMVRVLETEGLHVLSVDNGDAAVEACRAAGAAIDVAVLDVAMPPAGGADALRRIAALLPEIGFVMTSGASPDEALRGLLESTGGRFLQKPFAPDALRRAVREAVAGRRG